MVHVTNHLPNVFPHFSPFPPICSPFPPISPHSPRFPPIFPAHFTPIFPRERCGEADRRPGREALILEAVKPQFYYTAIHQPSGNPPPPPPGQLSTPHV